jgi:hypothetical protein
MAATVKRWVRGLSREMLIVTFSDWFGVQRTQAEVLVVLFEKEGRPLPCKRLGQEVSSHRPVSPGAIWERIRGLREVMEPEGIDHGVRGYLLTEVGLAECRKALRTTAESLIRHGYELPPIEAAEVFELVSAGD